MKKALLSVLILGSTSVFAQTLIPWYLSGNTLTNTSYFGSNNNFPIRFETNGVYRMKLNENVSYSIDGLSANRDGYLLIGQNNPTMFDWTSLYDRGAYSLLHLNGPGTYCQQYGYRTWMETGVTFTGNKDLSYFGLRKLSTDPIEEDITETTIAWADNNNSPDGPDDLVFRFIGIDGGDKTTVSSNFSANSDLDGLAVARFTPTSALGYGLMGLGNTFGLNATGMNVGYVRPQNLLHMSVDGNKAVFMQITNQGMGQTANDGLHIGYAANNLEARIIQRENANLSLFTSGTSRFTITGVGNVGAGVHNGNFSGGANNPQNALEVNAPGTTNGNSGLRFTDLKSTGLTPQSNPGLGVLSVNSNGDVIYVEGGGAGVGGTCGNAASLTAHFDIPLNNFSYNFTAGANENSSVNIGNDINCGMNYPARLYVHEEESITGAAFHSAIVGHTEGNLLPDHVPSYGIVGINVKTKSVYGQHAGVYGVSVQAENDILTAVTEGIGVSGTAYQSERNIGVMGTATDVNAQYNYGVWGEASNASITNRAGYFLGNLEYTGTFTQPSDQMLKTNIAAIENADSILNLLSPKTFEYDTAGFPQLSLSGGVKMGFIAQDVELVLPQLVKQSYRAEKRDSLGNLIYPEVSYKSLNNEEFVPLLVAGYKEQQLKIRESDSIINALRVNDSLLNDRLTSLENCINVLNLCDGGNGNGHGNGNNGNGRGRNKSLTEVHLQDAQAIVLEQNQPNPFAEQTTINYFLPDYVTKAEILFYNVQGRLVQSAELSQKGEGQLTVFAQDLSSGIYTYTLVVDGTVFETKKMVKQ